jgi:hypothetical protein
MAASGLLPRILFVLGCGFLVANLLLLAQFVRYLRRRRSALLTWPGPRPKYYGLLLAIGVTLGCLVFFKLVFQLRPPRQLFGEAMMFVYYGYALPLSRRIGRGFYEDGIWSETGFMPYWQIGGIAWREGPEITLILISRIRNLARRLVVPGTHYAAARRLLRDKIQAHDIDFTGTGLDLGVHDERDNV